MDNLTHKILKNMDTHQTPEGHTVPTIPGGDLYDVGRFITVYGPPDSNRRHHAIAFCEDRGSGKYLVFTDPDKLSKLDPLDKGDTVEDVGVQWSYYICDGTVDVEGEPWRFTKRNLVFTPPVPPGLLIASKVSPFISGRFTITSADYSYNGMVGGQRFDKAINPVIATMAAMDIVDLTSREIFK